MLKMQFWQQVCDDYQFGKLAATPIQQAGSRLHRVFSLETSTGNFAAKLLNPELVSDAYLQRLNLAEQVAHQFYELDIPTITAFAVSQHSHLSGNNKVLKVGDACVMVFPWVSGKVLSSQHIHESHAEAVGQCLGKIHQANLPSSQFNPPLWQGFSEQHWQQLAEQAEAKGLPCAAKTNQAVSFLSEISILAAKALPHMNGKLILSHCDFDLPNVIWQNAASPVLIDWEYAGLVNPAVDLFTTAINWSVKSGGLIDKFLFQAVLNGYQSVCGKTPIISEEAVAVYLGYCLEWIEFCLRHGKSNAALQSLKTIMNVYMGQEQYISNRVIA
jgi:Ser/Thr protein kinase RdoA (MazF antagonist)